MQENINNLLIDFLQPEDLKSFPGLYEVVQANENGFEAIKHLICNYQSAPLYIPKVTSIPATRNRAIMYYVNLGYSAARISRVLNLSEKLIKDIIKENNL